MTHSQAQMLPYPQNKIGKPFGVSSSSSSSSMIDHADKELFKNKCKNKMKYKQLNEKLKLASAIKMENSELIQIQTVSSSSPAYSFYCPANTMQMCEAEQLFLSNSRKNVNANNTSKKPKAKQRVDLDPNIAQHGAYLTNESDFYTQEELHFKTKMSNKNYNKMLIKQENELLDQDPSHMHMIGGVEQSFTQNQTDYNCKIRKQRKFRDLFEPLIDLTQPNVTTIMQRPVDMGETKRYKRKNFDDLEKRRTYTCKYDG